MSGQPDLNESLTEASGTQPASVLKLTVVENSQQANLMNDEYLPRFEPSIGGPEYRKLEEDFNAALESMTGD